MTTTNVLLQAQLDTVLVDWNVKWKEFVGNHKKQLTHPDFKAILRIMENMVISDVYTDDNSYSKAIFVFFIFDSELYRLQSYDSKNYGCKWDLRDSQNSFSDLAQFGPAQNQIFSDFLAQFEFRKIDKQLKKLKVDHMLKSLCATHVGKVIDDVVDDGNLIKIKLTNEKIYYYNDFLSIGRVKEKLNHIDY
jgi:hypothetical protein